MNWDQAVTTYLDGLRDRHYSRPTLEITKRWMQRLTHHCQRRAVSLTAVGKEHLAVFHQGLLWERTSGGTLLTPNTVDQALRVVRAFFRWAAKHQVVLVDPTAGWLLRRVTQPLRPLPSVGEVDKLLALPDLTRPGGLRDRAILETFYATGLRRTECHNLDVDDVDLDAHMVRVRGGKGAKDRWLPMGTQLSAMLARYLHEARPILAHGSPETALFLSRFGTRFSTFSLNSLVAWAGRKVGLRLSPHLLRHYAER